MTDALKRFLLSLPSNVQADILFVLNSCDVPLLIRNLPEPMRFVQFIADKGEKILAIQAYRTQAGVGLKEAKDVVEFYMTHHYTHTNRYPRTPDGRQAEAERQLNIAVNMFTDAHRF